MCLCKYVPTLAKIGENVYERRNILKLIEYYLIVEKMSIYVFIRVISNVKKYLIKESQKNYGTCYL